jgi:AAA ATPase domain
MQLDLRADRRAGLLGRSDTLALLEIHVEKVTKQAHVPIPVVTGRRGMGRTAVLREMNERSKNSQRPSGFGCVRSGLGQALIDAVTSLAESIQSLQPDSPVANSLFAEADGFQRRSPDEATEEEFVVAIDHLLYALSNAVTELSRGYVLCVDDLHAANDARVEALLEGLEALSSTGAPIPMIFSRAVGFGIRPLPKGLDELQLRALTNADLADLAQRKGIVATPEVIRLIGDFVEGRPGQALEIVNRAAAKGLVDAHTVRAVISEAQSAETVRTAQVEAERRAAMDRTSPTAPTHQPLVTQEAPPATPAGAPAYLTPPAQLPDATVMTAVAAAPVVVAAAPVNLGPAMGLGPMNARVAAVSTPTGSPTPAVLAVPVAPQVAAPAPAPASLPVQAVAPAAPVLAKAPAPAPAPAQVTRISPVTRPAPAPTPTATLSATQRRVLERAANLVDTEGSLRVEHLKRVLGEVNRFGGGASPVSEAVLALVGDGMLTLAGPDLAVTAAGRQYLATTPG